VAYTRKPKVFRVSFEEPHPLAGLTVVTKGLSIKEFAAFGLRMGQVESIQQNGLDAKNVEELIAAFDEVRTLFAEALVEWDMLDEDGTPTPATLEGVQSLTDNEFFGIVSEWLNAVGGPSPDLGKDSGLGGTIPALSDLMEPLSPSPAN
jgi:hypothetical protein